jgi:hypothetical protein
MVISYSNIKGFCSLPFEYDSPLLVNAHAMETDQIPFECFEAISRWGSQFSQGNNGVQDVQFV